MGEVVKMSSNIMCKCVSNPHHNSNFTVGKTYEVSMEGIRCNFGGMWIHFEEHSIPKELKSGHLFKAFMCGFLVLD